MKDVTKKYSNMLTAIECDFLLAANPESGHGLDELQLKIENRDERILADIALLQELSFGVRYGNVKIMEMPESWEPEPVESRALDIAAVIMHRVGLCRHESTAECQRKYTGALICCECIKEWLLLKARKELKREGKLP